MPIILAYDISGVADKAQASLEKKGYEIQRCYSNKDVVSKLSSVHYQLMITQLIGSGVDGIQLMNLIKGNDSDLAILFGMNQKAYSSFVQANESLKILVMDPCRTITKQAVFAQLTDGTIRAFKGEPYVDELDLLTQVNYLMQNLHGE